MEKKKQRKIRWQRTVDVKRRWRRRRIRKISSSLIIRMMRGT